MLVVFETKINLDAFKQQIHSPVSRSGILYVVTARRLRLVHKNVRKFFCPPVKVLCPIHIPVSEHINTDVRKEGLYL